MSYENKLDHILKLGEESVGNIDDDERISKLEKFAASFKEPWANLFRHGINAGAYWGSANAFWLAGRSSIPAVTKDLKFKSVIYRVHDWVHQLTPSLSPRSWNEETGEVWVNYSIAGEIAVLTFTEFMFTPDHIDELWSLDEVNTRNALDFTQFFKARDPQYIAKLLLETLVTKSEAEIDPQIKTHPFFKDYRPTLQWDVVMAKRYWNLIADERWHASGGPYPESFDANIHALVSHHVTTIQEALNTAVAVDVREHNKQYNLRSNMNPVPWSTKDGLTKAVSKGIEHSQVNAF